MKISELLATPPGTFKGFVVTAADRDESEGPATARYVLSCRKCAASNFTLEEILAGEHGPAGIEATCGGCGEVATVFHASRDGYDGRLGHLRFLQEGGDRRPLRDYDEQLVQEAQVACEVTYSIEPGELAATAAEEDISAEDLFDGFAVLTKSPRNQSWRAVWEYECA